MSKDNLSGFNEFAGNGAVRSPAHPLDMYRPELRDMELTAAQETEILEILWSIMWHFAKMGQSVDVCGLFLSDANQASDGESAGGIIGPSPNKETPSTQGGKEAT